ncbi:DUF6456 domain-containing protein [Fretibacter rubidus]|uniref:DUF6456 domain-containing protein n=1 Tax=Fretibacter rubidus TaxID=570162 RepID=UPI00352A049A
MSGHITPKDRALLKRMIAQKSVIFDNGVKGILPVYPRGDRRTKPTGWIDRACFLRLCGTGDLTALQTGFGVAQGTAARLSNPVPERAMSEQHLGRETKTVYTPDAALRDVRMSKTGGSLRRLARKKHRDGTPVLSAAMVEAGERFSRDYSRTHGGDTTTQNYAAPMVDGGSSPGERASTQMAVRLDSGKRLAAAHEALGPGLDRVVIAICCNDHDLTQLERDEKWAAQSGMTVLQLGLSRLVDFYGTTVGINVGQGRSNAKPLAQPQPQF